jgi:hypothetical protein
LRAVHANDGEKQYIDFDRVNEEPQNWSYKNPLNSKTIVISNLLSHALAALSH